MLAPYRKFLVALGPVLVVLGEALRDGNVDATEVGLLAATVAGAVGVFFARNAPAPAPAE